MRKLSDASLGEAYVTAAANIRSIRKKYALSIEEVADPSLLYEKLLSGSRGRMRRLLSNPRWREEASARILAITGYSHSAQKGERLLSRTLEGPLPKMFEEFMASGALEAGIPQKWLKQMLDLARGRILDLENGHQCNHLSGGPSQDEIHFEHIKSEVAEIVDSKVTLNRNYNRDWKRKWRESNPEEAKKQATKDSRERRRNHPDKARESDRKQKEKLRNQSAADQFFIMAGAAESLSQTLSNQTNQ